MAPKKRYQVFVSSTFEDLKEERHEVMQAILDLHHFPAGMELFPSGNSKVFEYIKKIINQSDYYVVIIGNKYGRLTAEGMSFTEAEHDYAEKQEVPIIALVHARPDTLPVEKSDIDPVLRERLARFRDKVGARMVNKWETVHELGKAARTALHHAFQEEPRTGWVRADEVATVATPQADGGAELRAGLEAQVRLSGTYRVFNNAQLEWMIDISILDLYYEIFPSIERIAEEEFLGSVVPKRLARRVLSHEEFKEAKLFVFYPGQLDRVRNRLQLLNLISVEMRERDMAWVPTSLGRQIYLRVDAALNPLTPPPETDEATRVAHEQQGVELASLDEQFEVFGQVRGSSKASERWSLDLTWAEIWATMAPAIVEDDREESISHSAGHQFFRRSDHPDAAIKKWFGTTLGQGLVETFRYHFLALGFITAIFEEPEKRPASEGGGSDFPPPKTYRWKVTDKGMKQLIASKAVRTTRGGLEG